MPTPSFLNFHAGPSLWEHPETGDRFAAVTERDMTGRLWHQEPDGTRHSLDLAAIPGNPLDMPFIDNGHHYPSVAVTGDGFVYVIANMRSDPIHAVVSDAPLSILDGFTDAAATFEEDPDYGHTYPQWTRTSTGVLFMQHRRRVVLPVEESRAAWPLWRHTPGVGWENLGETVAGIAAAEAQNPYLSRIYIDPRDDVLRMGGAWNLEADENIDRRHPFYMESHDLGDSWRNVQGVLLPKPLTYGDTDLVAIGSEPAGVFSPCNGASLDQNGLPTITGTDVFGGTWRARWTGSTWALSTPSVQTGVAGEHVPAGFQGDLWYCAGDVIRSVLVRRDGLKAQAGSVGLAGIAPYFDPGAFMDGRLQILAFDPDGDTPRFRGIGAGARFQT